MPSDHAIADAHRLSARRDAFDEFVRDLFDHNGATGRGAALAGRSESSLGRVLNREIHVAVFENYNRILAAHLALALCPAPRNLFVKPDAHWIRSSERNCFDCRMIDDFIARLRARAQN